MKSSLYGGTEGAFFSPINPQRKSNGMEFMILFGMLFTALVNAAGAASPEEPGLKPELTTEQRKKLAQFHEKMATCLKSNTSFSDCHKQMRTDCQSVIGHHACLMRGDAAGVADPTRSAPQAPVHEIARGNGRLSETPPTPPQEPSSSEQPPQNRISLEEAQAIALKKFPGTVKKAELERENGLWVYSFKIVSDQKTIAEVEVDAMSGKITEFELESET
ncbi:MAG: PepSY domain-containing protein [Bdellovibrionia bacterium]